MKIEKIKKKTKNKNNKDFNQKEVVKKNIFLGVEEEKIKVYIIGTSHVSEEAKNKIILSFLEYKPEIIALELDRERAYALEHNIENKNNFFSLIKEFGLFATFFFYIGRLIQKSLGEKLKFKAGSEMLEGIKIGKTYNIPIALVDKNIKDTFKSFKKIPLKEKIKLFYFMFRGKFYDEELKSLDLKKIPSDRIVEKIIFTFKKDFPIFYDVLVESRNKYMSRNIIKISRQFKKILLVVGKGHVEGIKKILEKEKNIKIKLL